MRCKDVLQYRLRLTGKFPRAPGPLQLQMAQKVVLHAQQFFFGGPCRSDAHGAVELAGIAADDLRAEMRGQCCGRMRFTAGRGAADHHQQAVAVHQ